jgi:hypothetical protein
VVLLAAGLLGLSGCAAKVNDTIKTTLNSEKPDVSYEIPAVSSERTITVEVTANAEVDIYVVKKSDADDFTARNAYDKRPAKAIASVQKIKEGKLDATIPGGTETLVIVARCDAPGIERKPTDVSGKITSK